MPEKALRPQKRAEAFLAVRPRTLMLNAAVWRVHTSHSCCHSD